jgi:hypothetical protein
MTKEDDELNQFKLIVVGLVKEAKSLEDLQLKLLDDVSASFSDFVAKEKLVEEPRRKEGVLPLIQAGVAWCQGQISALTDGPPSSDPLTRGYIKGLLARGVINKAERKLVNLYGMIRLDLERVPTIFLPRKISYLFAAVFLVVLLGLCVCFVCAIWEVVEDISVWAPMSYAVGGILGCLIRRAFDSAWGREWLAYRIKSRNPWICVAVENR